MVVCSDPAYVTIRGLTIQISLVGIDTDTILCNAYRTICFHDIYIVFQEKRGVLLVLHVTGDYSASAYMT